MWVPPKVEAEHLEARRQHDAELLEKLIKKEVMDDFNRELKQIDEYLELVWAPESVTTPGLVPARWHVIRHNPLAPTSLIPLVGPDNEYVEPDSSIFDFVRAADLWNDAVARDRKKREEALEVQKQRRKNQERAELREEFVDRAKAAFNPGVSMTDAGPWSYRAGARTRGKTHD